MASDAAPPPPVLLGPVGDARRQRSNRTPGAPAGGLALAAAFSADCNCDDPDCDIPKARPTRVGFDALADAGLHEGSDAGESGSELAKVIAEVERDVAQMMGWEKIAALHASCQVGHRALDAGRWDDAGDSYVRALAIVRAIRHSANKTVAAQTSELRRLSEEVFCGLALLQLRWAKERQGSDAHQEMAPVLRRAAAHAQQALELNENSSKAYARLALARARLAWLPSSAAEREELLAAALADVAKAEELDPTNEEVGAALKEMAI